VQDKIVDYVRSRILDGRYQPGDRVPGRVELEQRFKVSNLTVQRAFDRLIGDGFVETHGRRGTHVVEAPPHLTRFVLAFPCKPKASAWVNFWQVMTEVAPTLLPPPKCFDALYGIARHLESEDLLQLYDDVRERRLAGILFASPPFEVRHTPILDVPGVPRVCISEGISADVPCTISPEAGLVKRAVDFLVLERNRKRVAMLSPRYQSHADSGYAEAMAAHRLLAPPHFVHAMSPSHGVWAYNLALLLLRMPKADRPDGLIVADDNFLEPVCEAVRELGISTPDELDVVTHCNFPEPLPKGVNVSRLGYDIPRLLRLGVDLLEQLREGAEVPNQVLFPLQFEWELEG